MKVLVLGGTGFLGQHIMRLLRDMKDVEAYSISRREGTDICNLEQFVAKLKEIMPDQIINCAAHVGSVQYVTTYAADLIRDNTLLAINTYEGVRIACPTAKIINPLSNCSYPGEADTYYEPEWQKGAPHDSVLAYGVTRRLMYGIGESYRKQANIHSVNWLIANAYGPGDYTDPNKVHALNGILIRLIQAQRKNDATFEIWGTGKPVREWVYVEDVAKILIQSLNIDEQTYPINLAQKKAYSITEIAELGAKALGYNVAFTYNTSKLDGAPIKIMDDQQFREKHPDFVFMKLDEGIRNTIEYYKKVL